jgi:hypothetical protein
MYDAASVYFDRDFEDRMSDDHKYCGPIFYLLFFMMPLGTMSDYKKRSVVYGTVGTVAMYTYSHILACVSLFLLLFCVKLSSDTSVSWWAVFLPLLLQCCILIGILVVGK